MLFVRANLQHHDTVFMKEVINRVGRAPQPSGSRKVWSPGVFVSLTLQNQLPRWPKLQLEMRKKSGAAVLSGEEPLHNPCALCVRDAWQSIYLRSVNKAR